MKSSTDYQTNQSFALLLLGRPKSGKTTLSLRFPNCYIADCDNNLGSAVRILSKNHPFKYDTINVDDNGKPIPPEERYLRLNTCLANAAEDSEIKTLIIDGCISLQEYIQDDIKRQVWANEKKRLTQLRIQDWGTVAHYWRQLVTRIRSCGKMVIFTAHTKLERDELDGSITHQVLVQGQMKDCLAGLFSDCWLTFVESQIVGQKRVSEYKIRTTQDAKYLDLGTSLNLPTIIENDYDKHVKPLIE